eukprot:5364668-Amphidinium_carterae.2
MKFDDHGECTELSRCKVLELRSWQLVSSLWHEAPTPQMVCSHSFFRMVAHLEEGNAGDGKVLLLALHKLQLLLLGKGSSLRAILSYVC